MTALQWWGVAILAWAFLNTAWSAFKAIRDGRFGIKYVTSKDILVAATVLVMGTVFFYGWFKFPDAPISECAGPTGFCGKQGQPHSFSDYHQFDIWQTSMFVVWPLGMLIAFLLNRKRSSLDTEGSS